MTERENIFIRIFKRLGIITEYEVSKEDMCKHRAFVLTIVTIAFGKQKGVANEDNDRLPKQNASYVHQLCVP